jgi:hypothetical protein
MLIDSIFGLILARYLISDENVVYFWEFVFRSIENLESVSERWGVYAHLKIFIIHRYLLANRMARFLSSRP